jgi:hypothetical protein
MHGHGNGSPSLTPQNSTTKPYPSHHCREWYRRCNMDAETDWRCRQKTCCGKSLPRWEKTTTCHTATTFTRPDALDSLQIKFDVPQVAFFQMESRALKVRSDMTARCTCLKNTNCIIVKRGTLKLTAGSGRSAGVLKSRQVIPGHCRPPLTSD